MERSETAPELLEELMAIPLTPLAIEDRSSIMQKIALAVFGTDCEICRFGTSFECDGITLELILESNSITNRRQWVSGVKLKFYGESSRRSIYRRVKVEREQLAQEGTLDLAKLRGKLAELKILKQVQTEASERERAVDRGYRQRAEELKAEAREKGLKDQGWEFKRDRWGGLYCNLFQGRRLTVSQAMRVQALVDEIDRENCRE